MVSKFTFGMIPGSVIGMSRWGALNFEQLHRYTPLLATKKTRFGNVLYARFGKANLRLFWQPIWCISLTWSATGQVTFRSLRFTDGRYVFLSGVESV